MNETTDMRPSIEIKVSPSKIGIFSKDLVSFEKLPLVDGKLLLDKTPNNFAAVSMLAQKYERTNWRVTISDSFAQDRATCHAMEPLRDTPLWNTQFPLREGQRALATRIFTALGMLKGAYNCSEPGSGKTPTSIFVAQQIQFRNMMRGEFRNKFLVVAPGNLLWQWAGEVERFYSPFAKPSMFVIGKGAKPDERQDVLEEALKAEDGWVFVTYDTLRIEADRFASAKVPFQLCICDECTVFINKDTQSSDAFSTAVRANAFGRTILLSGTPIRSSGADLHNPLCLIGNPYAVGYDYNSWTEMHAVKSKVFIEKVGERIVRRGVNNIFTLMAEIGQQFMGIPSDSKNVPKENEIIVPIPMTPDEERTYRAVEMGYSITPGLRAEEEADAEDKIELSQQLDNFRDSDSLGDYLATVTEYATHDDGGEFDLSSIGLTPDGEMPETIDDFEQIINAHKLEIEEIENAVNIKRAEITAIDLQVAEVRQSITHIKQNEENQKLEWSGGFYYNQDHVELAKLGTSLRQKQEGIKDERNELQAQQQAIREEKIRPIQERIAVIKKQLRQDEQARHSTLRRLLRAAAGTQWIISPDGTERILVETPSSKIDWIIEHCKNNDTMDSKTIIFCIHRHDAERIQRELKNEGINCLCPITRTKEIEIEQDRLDFMKMEEDAPHVIVMTCGRGVGLNLQAAKNVVFFNFEFRGDLNRQNVARAVREFSNQESVNIYYLMLQFEEGGGTVDEYVFGAVKKKLDVMAIVGANAAPIKLKRRGEEMERVRMQTELLMQQARESVASM